MNNLEENMEQLLLQSARNEKSLSEIGLKLTEETGEVAQALLTLVGASGSEYKGLKALDVFEECVETIMVATSLLVKLMEWQETDDLLELFNEVLETKLDKWERVTGGQEEIWFQ